MKKLTFLFFVFLGLQLNAQLYTFQNLNHRDGLHMGTVNCVNQSSDGRLWIGTDGSELMRYDGTTFEELKVPNADNNHHFENIFIDENKILFAARYKGFFQYNPAKNEFEKLISNEGRKGEALGIYKNSGYYYFIESRAIRCKKVKGVNLAPVLHSLNNAETDFEIVHVVETNNSVFLFTNHGGFVMSEGAVIPLKKWLGVIIRDLESFQFGHFEDGRLRMFNNRANRWLDIEIKADGKIATIKESKSKQKLSDKEFVLSYSHNKIAQKGAFLTNLGRIYQLDEKNYSKLAHNYNSPLEECTSIFTDLNGDYWVTSDLRGLYKISLEPFTKIQLDPIYEWPNISFTYRTNEGRIILSMFSGETYTATLYKNDPFKKYPFVVKGITEINSTYYLATNTGVRLDGENENLEAEPKFFRNQNITFIKADGIFLWVGVAGKGLFKINSISEEITEMQGMDIELPNYFYSSQFSPSRDIVYFGTNNGVYEYSTADKTFSKIKGYTSSLGSYSGVSATDIYGTCWFTLEKGILGITRDKKIRIISGEKYFRTNLFYTLNSDQYGNLIIGTNKGITIIKVDKNGYAINSRHFDEKSGFRGYEAHMRSQFQDNHQIFLGTIEGLFLIDTKIIEDVKKPIAPTISLIEKIENKGRDNTSEFDFQVRVNNAKAGKLFYSYRIIGKSKEWIQLQEDQNTIHIHGLNNGKYVLEVRATYDNSNYSDSNYKSFVVNLPIWKTNWFILILIASAVIFNIGLIYYYNFFDGDKLLNTKDLNVHLRMSPAILLFATIVAPFSMIIAPVLDSQLESNLGISLTLGFILLALYLLTLTAKSNKQEYLYPLYLRIGLFVITGAFMWEIYSTCLHPFYIISIVIVSVIAPVILSKIKSTIIYGIVLLSLSISFVVIIDETIYPKFYFILAMFIMACIMIFSSYLRYDSLEKLIFISGIINKGNIPAIAFNKEGKITYASENISNFVDTTHDQILNTNISILNKFIPFGKEYIQTDITKEFKDGEKYLVPLADVTGKVRWIEWSYKDFSNEIKVILGQDVSEKMELENTYELLVQNAEDFIYRCDSAGNFLFLNDICFTKLGYKKEELLNTLSLNIVHREFRSEVANSYKEHFDNHKSSSYKEFPIVNKKGDIIWVGQYLTSLYAPGSKTNSIGFIALARDITELRAQQELITEQQDSITASINYARRIQYNLLPREHQFKEAFNEHFIISKPKDIVSGDFYWMETIDNQTILVVSDCTGHGVPGSFMTLLGNNLLNSIVLEDRVVSPSVILNELDLKLTNYLPKGEGRNMVNDGMEVTVCVFDRDKNEMSFACAGSRFLIYENGSFTMYKGDNKHIGDTESNFTAYNSHFVNFTSDMNLFLFTDGFQDQFGGPKDKKYSFRRLLELFEFNINLPLSEQKKMIEDDYKQWSGKNQQTDDITILSVKRKYIKFEETKRP